MSSIDVDECGHKLLKLSIPEGHEIELCNMIVECCSQERTYLKYYGLLAERFCRLNVLWEECFAKCFASVYSAVFKIDTGRIRNITKLYGHLLETDAIPWTVFSCVRLTEDDTTAAGRIFLKFLLQELAEFFSAGLLKTRLADASLADAVSGLYPRDTLRNIRFSISFFEAIELPMLAECQRKFIADLEAELEAEEDNRQVPLIK
jgi:pre-mRNA-splicing factor CWC22